MRSQQLYSFMIEGAFIPCVNLFVISSFCASERRTLLFMLCCGCVGALACHWSKTERICGVQYVGKVDPFSVGHLRRPCPCLGQVSDSNARYDNLYSSRYPCITHSWNYSIRHYCASPLCMHTCHTRVHHVGNHPKCTCTLWIIVLTVHVSKVSQFIQSVHVHFGLTSLQYTCHTRIIYVSYA